MDDKQLNEYLDQQRWLLNSGLISEPVKNQLFFCGSIVHKEVQAVELDLDVEKKTVAYQIYFHGKMIDKINKYKELSSSKTLIGMWRFKRMLKKNGSLDFHSMLNNLIKDYCGPKWSAAVEIRDFAKYVDGADSGQGISQSDNKPADEKRGS